MTAELEDLVKDILTEHFNVSEYEFDWHKPLQELNRDLSLLGHLAYFEQLLEEELGCKIPMLENISSNFHSAEDVLRLIRGNILIEEKHLS